MHLVQIISKNSKNMHKVAYKVCLIFGWEGCLCLKMIHEGLFTGKGGCQITKTRGWHDSMRLALVEVVEACLDYSKNFWAIRSEPCFLLATGSRALHHTSLGVS